MRATTIAHITKFIHAATTRLARKQMPVGMPWRGSVSADGSSLTEHVTIVQFQTYADTYEAVGSERLRRHHGIWVTMAYPTATETLECETVLYEFTPQMIRMIELLIGNSNSPQTAVRAVYRYHQVPWSGRGGRKYYDAHAALALDLAEAMEAMPGAVWEELRRPLFGYYAPWQCERDDIDTGRCLPPSAELRKTVAQHLGTL